MNISNYLSHINCFTKDRAPRVSSISAVQLACLFRTSLILHQDNDAFYYCTIFRGLYTLYSTEVLALLECLEGMLLHVFIPPACRASQGVQSFCSRYEE